MGPIGAPSSFTDLNEFFDKHGRNYLLSADSGKKDFAVVTNFKELCVYDFNHLQDKYSCHFSDLFDSINNNEHTESIKNWTGFLNDFGREKAEEKKSKRRKEVVEYAKPKEASPELQYVKRFGHMPSFEIPVGYDGKDFRETFKSKELPFLGTETIDWDGQAKRIENRIIWGDNLSVLRSLPSDYMDMIYIDPPFFSGRDYNKIFGDDDEVRTFSDIWDGGLPTYLAWLNARLWEMKRVLKETGSIFIHLDWHAAHYVKCELDKIFGYENFRNEIVWCYKSGGASKKNFSKKHDVILFYSKSKNYFFNPQQEKSYMAEGSGDNPAQKYYHDEKGKYTLVYRKDWWTDIGMLATSSHERIGYPTQKPEELIARFIESACPSDGIVGDLFSGGGTTIATAEKLGRKWFGCDISRIAVSVARDRLVGIYTKDAGIKSVNKNPKHGFRIEYHGVYEKDLVRELPTKEYISFILNCYQAVPKQLGDLIHGFREEKAIHVASATKNLRKDQVEEFHSELVERKIQNGIILTWNVSKELEKYVDELRRGSNGPSIQLVQVKLVDIDSHF